MENMAVKCYDLDGKCIGYAILFHFQEEDLTFELTDDINEATVLNFDMDADGVYTCEIEGREYTMEELSNDIFGAFAAILVKKEK